MLLLLSTISTGKRGSNCGGELKYDLHVFRVRYEFLVEQLEDVAAQRDQFVFHPCLHRLTHLPMFVLEILAKLG